MELDELDKKIEKELCQYNPKKSNRIISKNEIKAIDITIDNIEAYNDKGYKINLLFKVTIVFTNEYPNIAPKVFDLSNTIPMNAYNTFHINYDKSLCLLHPIQLYNKYNKNTQLSEFVESFIIPYYYSFFYFIKEGVMPFGEYSHNSDGDIEAIIDYFCLNNNDMTIEDIYYIFIYKKEDITSFLPEIEYYQILDRLYLKNIKSLYNDISNLKGTSIKFKLILFNYLKNYLFYDNLSKSFIKNYLASKSINL